jgi:4-azaleucine resistance transporter AzlC
MSVLQVLDDAAKQPRWNGSNRRRDDHGSGPAGREHRGSAPAGREHRGVAEPSGRDDRAAEPPGLRRGVKAGLTFVLPTLAIGMSFGVLAEPVMGAPAAIVMSILVFAGAAQFASVSILVAGGGLASAVSAGLLINSRFLPMGLAVAPALRGGPLRRAAEAQTMVDASWAVANRGDGTFDRDIMMGATIPQAAGWWIGTAIGALGGALLGDPEALGLDAMFPAFYLALLAEEMRDRTMLTSALLGGAIALVLVPFTPPGIPVVAAAAAALLGLRSR